MVDNVVPQGPAETLQAWLDIHGFLANPFATQEAAREEKVLGQYFVPPAYFDEIQGDARSPRTTFVFAPRGSGKTAMCLMIERFCQASLEGEGKILAVPYTDFTLVVEAVGGDLDRVTPRLHVTEILKQGVATLAGLLQRRTEFVQRVQQDFSQGERTLLQWYCFSYAHRLRPEQLSLLRERLGFVIHILEEPAEPFGFTRKPKRDRLKRRVSRELAILLDERNRLSPVQLLRDFVELVRRLGIDTVYILVDGVDELLETAADVEAASRLLAPLTANLRLLDMPHLAFKFFLPTEIMDCLLEQGRVRRDRVLIREIRWGEEELAEILRQRLRAFNRLGYDSLAAVCVPELRGHIDQVLIQKAQGSPRALLRLGELLLAEHCRWSGAADREIDEPALERALRKWETERGTGALEELVTSEAETGELAIGLWVDEGTGNVYVGGQKLDPPLTALEYSLLRFLYRNRGQICSKDKIAANVYQDLYERVDAASDAAIDRLVYRVRKRIEPPDRSPVYIITVRGRGYRLDNAVDSF